MLETMTSCTVYVNMKVQLLSVLKLSNQLILTQLIHVDPG